ncbi:MAG: recombinase family protein [Proteobacteria bacterium]|nr:recombinase family protein [Pseudomonadota bacterium]MBU1586306.1 recombinase family protein [Pseudomonadota bacterium]
MEVTSKITANHLKRTAYLYIRQSTVRQVFENTESTKRQYALKQRAVALGWPSERIEVIDTDLGQSGSTAIDRQGFQKLVAEVGLGWAGIVMGLEVSRLARNSMDWHRLIEICALTNTLILDEDGIYDPTDFNDRLLLGLKGTMSEAETHFLRARLRGGLLNKARRGELRCQLPVGLLYDINGKVILDPDQQIQASLHLVFETFLRTGTAHRTARHFRDNELLFPRKIISGADKGKVIWGPVTVKRVLGVLHNPRYAGAYSYGRGQWKKETNGKKKWEVLPRDRWQVLIPDAHPGYISWQQYENIDQKLCQNAQAYGIDRHHGPPREGPALLQGRVICGICGNRMSVRYYKRKNKLTPIYWCNRNYMEHGEAVCQKIPGASIDKTVGELLVEAMTPMAIEVSIAVQQEIQSRLDETDRLRQKQVERARYEANYARRRYMNVDPENRLVADLLEAEWNKNLRALAKAQDDYERKRNADRETMDKTRHMQLFTLAQDFPAIWNDPETPNRERKRMIALLIEDVTLLKKEQIIVQTRYRGGKTTTLKLPLPLNAWQGLKTSKHVLSKMDELFNKYTDSQVADKLNLQGLKSGAGNDFSVENVRWARYSAGLKSFADRLKESGLLTSKQMGIQLGVSETTVISWRKKGLLQGRRCNDKNQWLYFPNSKEKINGNQCANKKSFERTVGGAV